MMELHTTNIEQILFVADGEMLGVVEIHKPVQSNTFYIHIEYENEDVTPEALNDVDCFFNEDYEQVHFTIMQALFACNSIEELLKELTANLEEFAN